jgi:hypothetical protein
LRTLAVLATRAEPSTDEIAATRRALASGQLTIEAYIDRLIATPAFAGKVAPLVVMRQLLAMDAESAPSSFVLQHTTTDPPLYYLDQACAPDQALHIHPWWDLDHEIAVCPDAYRPDRWLATSVAGQPPTDCLSMSAPDEGGCGCGPNLVRCFASPEHREEVVRSLHEELRATVEYVVAHDLPIERAFTGNETFRDRNAELVRRIEVIEARHTRDALPQLQTIASWPAAGAWAPREELSEGQHAGVLTSPLLLYNLPDRRQRMAILYDPLWCVEPDSQGATPEMLAHIASPNLQLDGAAWHELAARPLCTNCHARLDYGMQFFWGYPNGALQSYFVPELQQHGKGPLYGHDISDLRGEAPLNPRGFAELAVAQPEFRECMARDFAAYVLGDRVNADIVEAIARHAQPGATSARTFMREALLALVVAWAERPAAPISPVAGATAAGGDVAVTPAMKAQLADNCLDCHDANPDRVDLSQARLPRATVIEMLDQVAFGHMPKSRALASASRRAFATPFIAALWTGDDAAIASRYFIGRMAALPAFRPELVLELAHGGQDARWRMFEQFVRSDLQQVTPGVATTAGVAAIEACEQAQKANGQAAIDRCIDESIHLSGMAIVPR